MKILLFGSTGMVGQGVLREALLDPEVTQILCVVRRPTGRTDPKLREVVLPDLRRIEAIDGASDVDAAIDCIGVSAFGLSEAEYTAQTYDFTLDLATALSRVNPSAVFLYVSGAGTDDTERGRFMWARVKGRTENALLRLPFRASYMFRPGFIQPLHGVRSRTGWYQALYAAVGPLSPVLLKLFPGLGTTTELLGRAVLHVARSGFPRPVLETVDINAIGVGSRSE